MGTEVIIALLSVFITVAVGAAGAFFKWLYSRRQTSGKIQTSAADVLWQQAQNMRETLLAQLQKTEEQRDKLIEGQSNTIIPALNSINRSLEIVLRYIEELRDGGHGQSSQQNDKSGEEDGNLRN